MVDTPELLGGTHAAGGTEAADRGAKRDERRENMKRIVVTAMVASFLALAGVLSTAPVLSDSVAYAEVSDTAISEQLAKIKMMVSDIEMKVQAKTMVRNATGREKAMKMLVDATKMLEQLYLMDSSD